MPSLKNRRFTIDVTIRTTLTDKEIIDKTHRVLESTFYDGAAATVRLDSDVKPGRLYNAWATLTQWLLVFWKTCWR